MRSLDSIQRKVVACRTCPRLVAHREEVARVRVRRFSEETYWGRPVPSFGDPGASVVLVGLAPAAHGANRTGRMFTGDRSGDFLYAALHRAGFAKLATSISADDGQRLDRVWITAAVRCAPPGNRPAPGEEEACRPFLRAELRALTRARVLIALGAFAWKAILRTTGAGGRFAHGAEVSLPEGRTLLGSYHPSQQNTFTGRLTPDMFDRILDRAWQLTV